MFSNRFSKKHNNMIKSTYRSIFQLKSPSSHDVLVLYSLLKGVEGDIEKKFHDFIASFIFLKL